MTVSLRTLRRRWRRSAARYAKLRKAHRKCSGAHRIVTDDCHAVLRAELEQERVIANQKAAA